MFLDSLMGLFSTDVAMDLGTANTLVFVKGRGIVLNEPSVVAVDTPTGNMVVDIGGGTTEIAVIALNGIVTKTSIRTGGDEMDDAIMNYAKKAYNMLIGEQTAERIKIEIGSAFPLPEEMDMEIKGRDLVRGIPRTLRVSSVEIREALQEPVGQIVNALRESLERTPPHLAAAHVDPRLLMTGGAG